MYFFSEGNTALFIAVEKNNLPAVKMLCSKGANINEIHPKNGYVPLRTAIEKQHTAIVKYLLTLKDISTIVKDFAGLDPLTAAVHKEISSELREAVEKYMVSEFTQILYKVCDKNELLKINF